MNNIGISFLFLCFAMNGLAQKSPEKIHLKKNTNPILVDRDPDTLFRYVPFDFGIQFKNGKKPVKVELKGGEVKLFLDRYWVSAHEGNSAILVVYDLNAKNETIPVWKKEFPVVGEEPILKIAGVPDGQTLEKLALGYYGLVTVEFPLSQKNASVKGFTMELINGGVVDTLRSNDAFLTPKMKDKLSRVESGTLVNFRNIQCRMPDGHLQTFKLVRIYVVKSGSNKYGN